MQPSIKTQLHQQWFGKPPRDLIRSQRRTCQIKSYIPRAPLLVFRPKKAARITLITFNSRAVLPLINVAVQVKFISWRWTSQTWGPQSSASSSPSSLLSHSGGEIATAGPSRGRCGTLYGFWINKHILRLFVSHRNSEIFIWILMKLLWRRRKVKTVGWLIFAFWRTNATQRVGQEARRWDMEQDSIRGCGWAFKRVTDTDDGKQLSTWDSTPLDDVDYNQ